MYKTLRHYSAKRLVLGIRREQKNVWERRVALVPEHVERLTSLGVKVYVQSSSKRVFTDEKYQMAGAIVHEDLSSCDVILGTLPLIAKQLIANDFGI